MEWEKRKEERKTVAFVLLFYIFRSHSNHFSNVWFHSHGRLFGWKSMMEVIFHAISMHFCIIPWWISTGNFPMYMRDDRILMRTRMRMSDGWENEEHWKSTNRAFWRIKLIVLTYPATIFFAHYMEKRQIIELLFFYICMIHSLSSRFMCRWA